MQTEARRQLPEAPLVPAESPDEHDVVVDDEPTELRRAVVPGFVEVAGVDHGADRARHALRTQWRRSSADSTTDCAGRRVSRVRDSRPVHAARGNLNLKLTPEPIVIELKVPKGEQVIINGEEK